MWLSLLPFGLGSWALILVGLRSGVRRWTVFGVLWSTVVVVGWALAAAKPSGEDLSGSLIVLGWFGGIVTAWWIRLGFDTGGGSQASERARWLEPTARSRRWSARYALLAYVCTFIGAGVLASVLDFGWGVHIRVGAGVLLVDAVLLGSLLPLRRQHGLSRDDLGLRAVPAVRSVGLVVLALVVYVAVIVLWLILVQPPAGTDTLANVRHESTINVVLTIVAAAVSAPIVEEIFFRGLLYRSLRNRLSILPAALFAGALFGLVHITSYPLDTLPVKAAFGVIACLLYERTGSLLPGIGLHSLVNASGINLALTGNDLIVAACSALVVVAVIVGAWVTRMAGRRRSLRSAGPCPGVLVEGSSSTLPSVRPRV